MTKIEDLTILRTLSSPLSLKVFEFIKFEKGATIEKIAKMLAKSRGSIRTKLKELSNNFLINEFPLTTIYYPNKVLLVSATDLETGKSKTSEDFTKQELLHLFSVLKDKINFHVYNIIKKNWLFKKFKKKRTSSLKEIHNELLKIFRKNDVSITKLFDKILILLRTNLVEIDTKESTYHLRELISKNSEAANDINIKLRNLVEIHFVPSDATLFDAIQSIYRIVDVPYENYSMVEYKCPHCFNNTLVFTNYDDGSYTVKCRNVLCNSSWHVQREKSGKILEKDEIYSIISEKSEIPEGYNVLKSISKNEIDQKEFVEKLEQQGELNLPFGVHIKRVSNSFRINISIPMGSSLEVDTRNEFDKKEVDFFEKKVEEKYENLRHLVKKFRTLSKLGFKKWKRKDNVILFWREIGNINEILTLIFKIFDDFGKIDSQKIMSFVVKVREFRKGHPNHRHEITIPKKISRDHGLHERIFVRGILDIEDSI